MAILPDFNSDMTEYRQVIRGRRFGVSLFIYFCTESMVVVNDRAHLSSG